MIKLWFFLQVILICLKVFGATTMSWWAVFFPFWVVVIIIAFVVCCGGGLFGGFVLLDHIGKSKVRDHNRDAN